MGVVWRSRAAGLSWAPWWRCCWRWRWWPSRRSRPPVRLFITQNTLTASATDIATYDAFVQASAAGSHTGGAHTAIMPYSSLFKVVGSTATVDARDHTATNPNTATHKDARLLAERRPGGGQQVGLLEHHLGELGTSRPAQLGGRRAHGHGPQRLALDRHRVRRPKARHRPPRRLDRPSGQIPRQRFGHGSHRHQHGGQHSEPRPLRHLAGVPGGGPVGPVRLFGDARLERRHLHCPHDHRRRPPHL